MKLSPSEIKKLSTYDDSSRRTWSLGRLDLGKFLHRITRVLDFSGGKSQPVVQEPPGPVLKDLRQLCLEAVEKNGKVAGLVTVAKVADAYGQLDEAGRDTFFNMLKDDFSVDPVALDAAIEDYQTARHGDGDEGSQKSGDGRKAEALVKLSRSLESPRHGLFKQFNTIPSGIKFLVDLRADLYPRLKRNAELAPLEYELRRLLNAFFNLGFLRLERIGWDSPAVLLENLIRYEAVHRITNWADLKHRLLSDRACYAFIHPAMPAEPVIFVEVALTQSMADNIQKLLDPDAPDLHPEQADTAIFYGISNAQAGLRGIPFGNLLIKQVATRLRGEVPNLNTFATLSPLPDFRKKFLDPAVADGSIADFFDQAEGQALCKAAGADTVPEAVMQILDRNDLASQPDLAEWLQPGLMRAVRHYICNVRQNGRATCPVAHFHGSNGALLARINWLADTSETGLAQSAGLMVNYLYDMENFENHQSNYLLNGTLEMAKDVQEI